MPRTRERVLRVLRVLHLNGVVVLWNGNIADEARRDAKLKKKNK